MIGLTAYLLLFLGLSAFFVFIHLVMGKAIRPVKPDAEKLTIYECGEPTVGSSWIQFDLRFYVVALLFVIFDVEVVFFFPWAVVFGKANMLARHTLTEKQRADVTGELVATGPNAQWTIEIKQGAPVSGRLLEETAEHVKLRGPDMKEIVIPKSQIADMKPPPSIDAEAGFGLAWLSFWDIMVFFFVLLVGFAYLWRRGDLDWVRSTSSEQSPGIPT